MALAQQREGLPVRLVRCAEWTGRECRYLHSDAGAIAARARLQERHTVRCRAPVVKVEVELLQGQRRLVWRAGIGRDHRVGPVDLPALQETEVRRDSALRAVRGV